MKFLNLILSLYALLTSFAVGAKCPANLTMGWDPWEPYFIDNKKAPVDGLDIEITKAISKKLGCEIKFKRIPWARHLKLVESGKVQLAAGASINPKRQTFANFSTPYRKEKVNLFVKKGKSGDFKFNSLEELLNNNSFSLGITRGYWYGEKIEQYLKDFKKSKTKGKHKHIQIVSRDDLNYSKLAVGRLNGFLADPFATYFTTGNKGMEAHPLNVYESDIFYMFSKKSVSMDFVKSFNLALDEIKKDGTLEKILNKYLGRK